MAMAGAPSGAGAAAAQAQPQQSLGGMLFGVVRIGVFWYFVMQMFAPKKSVNTDLLTKNLFTKGEDLVSSLFLCMQAISWCESYFAMYTCHPRGPVESVNF